jgi:hypothetical protein
MASFGLKVNGQQIGKMPQEAYWVVHLPPGQYQIGLGTHEVTVEAKPASVHFLRLDGITFREAPSSEAWPEIQKMKLDNGQ